MELMRIIRLETPKIKASKTIKNNNPKLFMDIHVQHTVVSFLHVTCLHLPGEIPKIVALLLEGILRLLSFPLLPVESLSTKICSEIKDVLNVVYLFCAKKFYVV